MAGVDEISKSKHAMERVGLSAAAGKKSAEAKRNDEALRGFGCRSMGPCSTRSHVPHKATLALMNCILIKAQSIRF